MATSEMQSAQMALRTCKKHDTEELDLYCRTCGKLLCADCIRESHVDHKWLVLKKYASELRALAPCKVLVVTSHIDSISKGHDAVFEYFKAEFDHEFSRNKTEFEAARSLLHRMVDEIIDKREDDLQRHSDDRTGRLESFSEDLKDALQRIKKLIDQLRDESVTLSNYDIVDLYDEIGESLLKLGKLTSIPKDCLTAVTVSNKTVNTNAMESMIGSVSIEQTSTTPVTTFVKDLDLVKDIPLIFRALPGCRIWFCSDDRILTLIECDGVKRVQCVTCRILSDLCFPNFDITGSGDICISDTKSKAVYSISQEGNSKVLFSTAPLIPTFLSVTYSGDILLSLCDELSYVREDTSRRLLRRTAMEGEMIKEYEYDNDGITPHFTHPGPSVEHYNGNMCIVNSFKDKEGRNTGTVLGLDFEGNVRFRYNGKDDNKIFHPLHLGSDMMGNTMISDYNSRCIHLIDAQGSFVMFLLSEQTLDFIPSLVAVCEHYLYVSVHKSGTLKVYNYKY